MTIIEKIFSRGAGKDVKPGDYIWANLSLVVMRDFGGPNVVQEYREHFDEHPVFDKRRVAVTFDLHIPPRNEVVARNQRMLREFATQQEITLFDVNTGVGQHVLLENGFVKPWDIIVGTDSHMNLLGAMGAAGFGMGTTDIAGAMYKGKLWFHVPETMKIVVRGKIGNSVTAKDVILYILKHVTTSGGLNRAIEFCGETVERMNLAERITLTSMVTEMSGDIGFIEPDEGVMAFINSRARNRVEPIKADTDALYTKVYEFSVDNLRPQIACPHSPDNVKDVDEVAGTKVDQVFIGSCTNGRFEDLKIAAEILDGNKVKDGVRLIIVPATMEVARQALEAGFYEIFLASGAVVTNPGCALCTTGHPGIMAPGEVMVSTSNRNFVGKLGKGAEVYLVSPSTAAATALTGEITSPDTEL
ncbi:MAG: 3-isopropylmalate dehydratase large subunit [candidate division WOR-3 bacterium]|nr:MAG: 3-isopropylmalate dehydratase large subunit [candidate division WOR-3 bacterium]